MSPHDEIQFCERGKSLEDPPFIRRHYRRWLMVMLRANELPVDYECWHTVVGKSLFRIVHPMQVDWTGFAANVSGYFMCHEDGFGDKPWAVYSVEGGFKARYSGPHEAENAIARLILDAAKA